MNKRVSVTAAIGCVTVVCLIGFIVVLPFILPAIPLFAGFVEIIIDEAYMQRPEVYEPVGRTLALYCQSDSDLFPAQLDSGWFPAELQNMGGWGYVSPDYARIEMGGGFHHYGYSLALDKQASFTDTNVWHLSLYSEDSADKHLLTFTLPTTKTILASSVLQNVLARYDEYLVKNPDNLVVHQRKIQLLLHFDKIAEARRAVTVLLNDMPDHWWANLVHALIVAESGSPEQAEQRLIDWVDREPDFFKYIDLAYYYQLQNQPQKAAQAMVKATQYDANTSWGHGGNSEFRGYNAAMYAFHAKEYKAAIRLSNKLLPVTVNGDYAKAGFHRLKEAAIKSDQGEEVTLGWASGIVVFDPFEDIDIDKLLQRHIERPNRENH